MVCPRQRFPGRNLISCGAGGPRGVLHTHTVLEYCDGSRTSGRCARGTHRGVWVSPHVPVLHAHLVTRARLAAASPWCGGYRATRLRRAAAAQCCDCARRCRSVAPATMRCPVTSQTVDAATVPLWRGAAMCPRQPPAGKSQIRKCFQQFMNTHTPDKTQNKNNKNLKGV